MYYTSSKKRYAQRHGGPQERATSRHTEYSSTPMATQDYGEGRHDRGVKGIMN